MSDDGLRTIASSSPTAASASAALPVSSCSETRADHHKTKQNHPRSAGASTEVKLRLQEFVQNRREQRGASAGSSSYSGGVASVSRVGIGVINQHSSGSLLERGSACAPCNSSHPYRPSIVMLPGGGNDGGSSQFNEGYCPLRKTASEPNIGVRSRLKQRVLERRPIHFSPIHRRKSRHYQTAQEERTSGGPIRAKDKLIGDTGTSSADMGTSLSSSSLVFSARLPISSTIHEEGSAQCDVASSRLSGIPSISVPLYSSPSMPNISLGRPPLPYQSSRTVPTDAISSQLGRNIQTTFPLVSHLMPPFCPVMPVIEGEVTPPSSPAQVQWDLGASGVPSGSSAGYIQHLQQLHPSLLAQPTLSRIAIPRTLNRTHSAPLPLGHPMLCPQRTLSDQQSVKQHIRHTLMSRGVGVHHLEEEEAGPPTDQEMKAHKPSSEWTSSDHHLDPAASSATVKDNSHPTSSPVAMVVDLTEASGDEPASSSPPSEISSSALPSSSTASAIQIKSEQFQSKLSPFSSFLLPQVPPFESSSVFSATPLHLIRPLARAHSSPLVTCSAPFVPASDTLHFRFSSKQGKGTGLVYDPLMLKHQCVCGGSGQHLEHSGRLQAIWSRLQSVDLVSRCDRVSSRKATLEELQLCHSQTHSLLFGSDSISRQQMGMSALAAQTPLRWFVKLPCGGVGVDPDTTWNELHTSNAARMAAGCVSHMALHVACGGLRNGFALVRPPGHHAERQQAMGFCYFNSVAIAANLMRTQLGVEKVLVVDWDVHHGNGTQQAFYTSSHVLYISVHRHDDGNFFPGTGATTECGSEDGMGFNVNVAWSGTESMSDAEYMAAFRTIVMPIAQDFEPDVVLVSCGFDAAPGHPAQLGGYSVSAACFGWMTHQLMQLANGKVVLALEGGYHIPSVCDASEQCVRALLDDSGRAPVAEEELSRVPCPSAVLTLQTTIAVQIPHWPCVKRTAHLAGVSHCDALRDRSGEATRAMADLSVKQPSTTTVAGDDTQSPASPDSEIDPVGGSADIASFEQDENMEKEE